MSKTSKGYTVKKGNVTKSAQNWVHIVLIINTSYQETFNTCHTHRKGLQSRSGTRRPKGENVRFLHSHTAFPFLFLFISVSSFSPPLLPATAHLPFAMDLFTVGEQRDRKEGFNRDCSHRWKADMQFIITLYKSNYSQFLSMLDPVQQHNDLQEANKR